MNAIYTREIPNGHIHRNNPAQIRDTSAYKSAVLTFLFLAAIFSFLALPLVAGLTCGGFLLLSSLCCIIPRQPYQQAYMGQRTIYQNTWFPAFYRSPVVRHTPFTTPVYRQPTQSILRKKQDRKCLGRAP